MGDEGQGSSVSGPQRGAVRDFLRFALGYWSTPPLARRARILAALCIGLLLVNLAINVGLNYWQRWFFDMLERREATGLSSALGMLALLIAAGAASAVTMVFASMTLQLEWRAWMTGKLVQRWVRQSTAGRTEISGESHGSPEFRIVEDVRLAIEPVVDFVIGFVNAALLGVTFVGVLVSVGGSASLAFDGATIAIPGYLALAAVIYALATSALLTRIGRPLIRRVADKNEAESQFFFQLTKAAEGHALAGAAHPADPSFAHAQAAFTTVVQQWRAIITERCRLTWITNANSFFAPILPLLLTAPKYMSGEMSLGAVMQAAAAFVVVLGALNWLTDNFVHVAEWAASARRVNELRAALFDQP